MHTPTAIRARRGESVRLAKETVEDDKEDLLEDLALNPSMKPPSVDSPDNQVIFYFDNITVVPDTHYMYPNMHILWKFAVFFTLNLV